MKQHGLRLYLRESLQNHSEMWITHPHTLRLWMSISGTLIFSSKKFLKFSVLTNHHMGPEQLQKNKQLSKATSPIPQLSFIPCSISPRDEFVVLLMHSWSFLYRDSEGYEYYRDDQRLEGFRKLLRKMSRDFDIIDSRDLKSLIDMLS